MPNCSIRISRSIRHFTGSFTITGMMWLGLSQMRDALGVEPGAQPGHLAALHVALDQLDSFRCRIEAVAAAATAGGSAVVKMKPLAKLRMKSHSAWSR
jgi:hypothetical protein